MPVKIAQPDQLNQVYDEILARSFPPGELLTREEFLTAENVLVEGEPPRAVAVGDYSPATGLLLLEYLAVAPEARGKGSGSALFTAAMASWRELLGPGAFLAEIERPDAHAASAEHGDPVRRLAFYSRLGLRALALPYYQPAVAPGLPPVPDLLLGVLVEDASWLDHGCFTEGGRIAALLRERNPNPTAAEADAWAALLAACEAPIPVVELNDFALIPRSGPIG